MKIYELLNRHFKDEEVAKALVDEIRLVMDAKTDLTNEISRLETRNGQEFKDQLKWFFILMMGLSALIIALLKLI